MTGNFTVMAPSLEKKLATMINYLEEVRSGRQRSDPKAFESYLDDPEVSNWLMTMKSKIVNDRFTHPR